MRAPYTSSIILRRGTINWILHTNPKIEPAPPAQAWAVGFDVASSTSVGSFHCGEDRAQVCHVHSPCFQWNRMRAGPMAGEDGGEVKEDSEVSARHLAG
jgi:hypothetical protein